MARPDIWNFLRLHSINRSLQLLETPETPDSLQILDLVTLNSGQRRGLRQRVKRTQGTVQLLIHPYFAEDDPEITSPESPYTLGRDAYIRRCLQQKKPLVIFEQHCDMPFLPSRLQQYNIGIIYTVPTKDKQAVLYGTPDTEKRVINALKDAGTKRVEVGGRFLTFDAPTHKEIDYCDAFIDAARHKPHARQWSQYSLLPGNCVGGAVRWLIGSFDVSFSGISEPETAPTNMSSEHFFNVATLFRDVDPNKKWT